MWVGAEGAEVGGRGLLGATQDIGGRITGDARTDYDYESRLESMPEESVWGSTPWSSSEWDSVSDPYVNAYINDPSTDLDVQTGLTYGQTRTIDDMMRTETNARLAQQDSAIQTAEEARVRNIVAKQEEERVFNEQQANAARIQAGALSMSGGPNYSGSNNAAISAVMQPQLDLAAQQRYMSSLDDDEARSMRAMAQGRNIGEVMRDMARQQQIADETAMGLDPFGGPGPARGIFGGVDESRNIRGE